MKYGHLLRRMLPATVIMALSVLIGLPAPVANALPAPVFSDGPVVTAPAKKKKWSCKDRLAQSLYSAGFRGLDLREAWAISMRESRGHARAISPTNDYGLFQFNYAAWHKADWWDSQKLLTPEYNAGQAFRISRGGKTWYPWDIGGRGQHLGRYTTSGTYAAFRHWYNEYPCAS